MGFLLVDAEQAANSDLDMSDSCHASTTAIFRTSVT
jgi:hypothetical protein